MSPRAAWRLEGLGFSAVYAYRGGKADWAAAGLPLEGALRRPRAGHVARRDAPTCRPDDRLQDVRAAVRAAGWDSCVVVNEERVVLGRLGPRALARDADVPVEEAMSPGPGTIRPSIPLERAARWMRERNRPSYVVTTSDGRLVGLLVREDAEAALSGSRPRA